MKKLTFLLSALLITSFSWGQTNQDSGLDFRVGLGPSFLGTGDMRSLMLETELNYQLSQYFTLGGGVAMGRSNNGVFETASFFQMNTNIYYSPFRNNKRNDFRIGGGLSYYLVSDAFVSRTEFGPGGQIINQEVTFDQRNSLGFNIIIENSYWITDKTSLGIKAFTQPYSNGDINSGVLLKVGFRL